MQRFEDSNVENMDLEESNAEGESGSEEEDSSILGPDHEYLIRDFAQHPVMDRVQAALHAQLTRTYDRIHRDLAEETEALRKAKRRREDFGVTLYSHQQQLSRLQQSLDNTEKEHNGLVDDRHESETRVTQWKDQYAVEQAKLYQLKVNSSHSQKQLDSLNDALRQVKTYNKEIKDEISITQRAANKISGETKNLEIDKQSQDIYINGLYEQVKRLRTEMAILEAQSEAQSSQSGKTNEIMKELLNELDLISMEKKQLMLQWKSSLVALARRDEALIATKQQCKEVITSTRDHDTEIESIRRDIHKSKEQWNALIMLKDRLESEMNQIDNDLLDLQSKTETTSVKFDIIEQSIIKENEKEKLAKLDEKTLSIKLTTVNNSIDIITKERHKLEESIENVKFEKSTVSKSADSLRKEDKNILRKIHEKELESVKIQNDLSRIEVTKINVQSNKQHLQLKLDNLNCILNEKNDEIEVLESNIKQRSNTITKYMQEVEKLNRKYNKMIDGVENPENLGPLEATSKSYEKEIEQLDVEIQTMKRKWLIDQEELVEIMTTAGEIQNIKRELNSRTSILNKKQSRLFQEIHRRKSEIKSINISINGMHTDKVRLDKLIGKHATQRSSLERENTIVMQEFNHELKEIKTNVQLILDNIKDIKSTKHLVLSQLVEVEADILEWKKKIQLEKEARHTVKSDDTKKVKGMEREINRMRHRLECLHRDQENMIRAMENAIYKREDIAVKYGYESRVKSQQNRPKSKTEIKKEISELKCALNKLHNETEEMIKNHQTMNGDIDCIVEDSKGAEIQMLQLAQDVKAIESTIDEKMFQKRRVLMRSKRIQELIKSYVSLEIGKLPTEDMSSRTSLKSATEKLKKVKQIITELGLRHTNLKNVLERVDELSSDIIVDLL